MARVLVATGDVLGEQLAGAGIRAWSIAAHLAGEHEVRLVSTAGADRSGDGFAVAAMGPAELRTAVAWADVVVAQGWVLARDRALVEDPTPIVVDLYDPMHLEQLEQGHEAGSPRGRLDAVRDVTGVLNEQLVRGDFFLCASERQRTFWLGQLAAVGRINPLTYDEDPTLRRLLDVVPFGVPDEAPVRRRPAAKGVLPGIAPDDLLLLWGGGIYNWFDPLTLLRAVDLLRRRVPQVRLLFLGVRHPNPAIPEMRMATATRRLAEELGLLGTYVFLNEGWVPYDERADFLLEADLGVSTHLDHVETEMAFRTRLLDCIWARTPIVATGGDALGDLIAERGLGLTVAPGDPVALAAALERALTDADLRAGAVSALAVVADELRWSRVLAPLAAFCAAPRTAPDRADEDVRRRLGPIVGLPARHGLCHDARLAMAYLSESGPKLLVQRVMGRLRRRWDERAQHG